MILQKLDALEFALKSQKGKEEEKEVGGHDEEHETKALPSDLPPLPSFFPGSSPYVPDPNHASPEPRPTSPNASVTQGEPTPSDILLPFLCLLLFAPFLLW